MQEFTPCAICLRTPLVGEQITVVRSRGREVAVCDGCLAKPRTRSLGEVIGRERIQSAAGAAHVHLLFPTVLRTSTSRSVVETA